MRGCMTALRIVFRLIPVLPPVERKNNIRVRHWRLGTIRFNK